MKHRNVTNWQKALVLAFRQMDVKKIKRTETTLLRRIDQAKLLGINSVSWY